jgi:hypothetical protein
MYFYIEVISEYHILHIEPVTCGKFWRAMQRFLHDLEASKELTDARNAAREAWRDYKRKEKEENLRRKELEKVERERQEGNRVHAKQELQVIDSSFLKIELNFPLIDLIGSCCRLSGGRWPILMW